MTRSATSRFKVGAYGFFVRDGAAKNSAAKEEGLESTDEPPCQKKLCFTSIKVEPLAEILYRLSLRDDCWFVKLDAEPRSNGMVRGRCFMTNPNSVAEVWREYKGTSQVFCTIQDDDFTKQFRGA